MAIGVGLCLMFLGQGMHFCERRANDPHHANLCWSFGWGLYVTGLFCVLAGAWVRE